MLCDPIPTCRAFVFLSSMLASGPLWLTCVQLFLHIWAYFVIRRYPPLLLQEQKPKSELGDVAKLHSAHIYSPWTATILILIPNTLLCLATLVGCVDTGQTVFWHWALSGLIFITWPLKWATLIWHWPQHIYVGSAHANMGSPKDALEFSPRMYVWHIWGHPSYSQDIEDARPKAARYLLHSVLPRLLTSSLVIVYLNSFDGRLVNLIEERWVVVYRSAWGQISVNPFLHWACLCYAVVFFLTCGAFADLLNCQTTLMTGLPSSTHHNDDNLPLLFGGLGPLLATSPRDLWGRRWNREVYKPFRQLLFPRCIRWLPNALPFHMKAAVASLFVFTISGALHEVFIWNVLKCPHQDEPSTRLLEATPTGETFAFFVLHGTACVVQTLVQRWWPRLGAGMGSVALDRGCVYLFLWCCQNQCSQAQCCGNWHAH